MNTTFSETLPLENGCQEKYLVKDYQDTNDILGERSIRRNRPLGPTICGRDELACFMDFRYRSQFSKAFIVKE